jgi:hypothetical protein
MSDYPANETRPSFSVSAESRVKLPLALLAGLLGACAAATAGWATIRSDVAKHSLEIAALQADARSARELLVRIDENVKALKESRK